MVIKELEQMSFTVRARIEIGKLAGHSANDFFQKLATCENEEESTNLIIDAVEIMHNAWLRKKAAEENTEFAPAQIDRAQFMELTSKEWKDVEKAVLDQITKDSEITVQTEAKKKAVSEN